MQHIDFEEPLPSWLEALPEKGEFSMSVSKKDRSEFEAGRKDREKGVFEQAFNDIVVNHSDTPAYYKGRSGRQFDDDKKKEKD